METALLQLKTLTAGLQTEVSPVLRIQYFHAPNPLNSGNSRNCAFGCESQCLFSWKLYSVGNQHSFLDERLELQMCFLIQEVIPPQKATSGYRFPTLNLERKPRRRKVKGESSPSLCPIHCLHQVGIYQSRSKIQTLWFFLLLVYLWEVGSLWLEM